MNRRRNDNVLRHYKTNIQSRSVNGSAFQKGQKGISNSINKVQIRPICDHVLSKPHIHTHAYAYDTKTVLFFFKKKGAFLRMVVLPSSGKVQKLLTSFCWICWTEIISIPADKFHNLCILSHEGSIAIFKTFILIKKKRTMEKVKYVFYIQYKQLSRQNYKVII